MPKHTWIMSQMRGGEDMSEKPAISGLRSLRIEIIQGSAGELEEYLRDHLKGVEILRIADKRYYLLMLPTVLTEEAEQRLLESIAAWVIRHSD